MMVPVGSPRSRAADDLLSGDLRCFISVADGVQDEFVPDDEIERLPGIGPLTGATRRFAEFSESIQSRSAAASWPQMTR